MITDIPFDLILVIAAILIGLKFASGSGLDANTISLIIASVVVIAVVSAFSEIVSRQLGIPPNRILPYVVVSVMALVVFKFMGGRNPLLALVAFLILFFTDSLVSLVRNVAPFLPPDVAMAFYAIAAVLFFLSLF